MGYGVVDGWNALGDVGRDGTACTANCRPFRSVRRGRLGARRGRDVEEASPKP